MKTDVDHSVIADVRSVYQQQRNLAEAALAQINDDQFFETTNHGANSLAIIVKHVGGNLRSRWTDFLHSDGEKPDRNRDGEFVVESDTRADVMKTWENGWRALDAALATLAADDLTRSVAIRGAPYTASQALFLNLAHTSHHCGQIVQLAKQLAGERWQTLSIPRPGAVKASRNLWK
jgi:uncharacterized damage-inducible protein DinB